MGVFVEIQPPGKAPGPGLNVSTGGLLFGRISPSLGLYCFGGYTRIDNFLVHAAQMQVPLGASQGTPQT